MNCQNFESIVNELARQKIMEASTREQATAHLNECRACALRLHDERALTQSLQTLTSEMDRLEAPAWVEGKLLAAFRQNQSARSRRSIHAWHYWASAAAAVLLVVIAIAAMSLRLRSEHTAAALPYIPSFQPRVGANPPDVIALPPPVNDATESAIADHGRQLTSGNRKRTGAGLRARRRPADRSSEKNGLTVNSDSTVAANYGGNEIATEFFPIGYTSPMNLQDGGQVMRVELPRSTLAGFGLPFNMDRVNERVTADVLVGPDGQARAIRFLQ